MKRQPPLSDRDPARLPADVVDALADALAMALVLDLQGDLDRMGHSPRGTNHTDDEDE